MEKKNMDLIYNMMSLMRYENHTFLKELEEKQNKLVKDMFDKQKDENISLLCNFVLMLNDEDKNKEE